VIAGADASFIGSDIETFIASDIGSRSVSDVASALTAIMQRAGMAMRMTTVRLSEPLYRELQQLAERDGVSLAQWIRDAAIAQLNFERGAEWARATGPKPEEPPTP
jgi:hypothetical protein